MDFKPVIDLCDKVNVKYINNANTSSLNSFKVGGYARLVVYPNCLFEFCDILDVIVGNKFKFVILGNGTNVYFGDYFDGIIIVTKHLSAVTVEENYLTALCGTDLTLSANYAYKNALTGLEFAYGIPGTVGGALYMNASAFGKSISQIVYKSIVYDLFEKRIREIYCDEHKFEEKSSVFLKEKRYVVIKAVFNLSYGKTDLINEKMQAYMSRRIESQPLNLPSAGSVFVKPKNNFASKLIDEAGLKGTKIGGIEVSQKHAGFFVNTSNGTAKDVNDLIFYVKSVIKEKYNIHLKEEIIFIE